MGALELQATGPDMSLPKGGAGTGKREHRMRISGDAQERRYLAASQMATSYQCHW